MADEEQQQQQEEQEQEEQQQEEQEQEEQQQEEQEQEEEEESEEEEDDDSKPVTKADLKNFMEQVDKKINSKTPSKEEEPTPTKDEEEWTLQKCREYEDMIARGELDPKYSRFLGEKKAELIAKGIAKEERESINFRGQWNDSRIKAVKEFPELADEKSELFKLAAKYVQEDPSYKNYVKLVQGGKKVDLNTIDPDLQYKCAQRAFGVLKKLESAKPKSTQKGLAKTSLEGKTFPKASTAKLDALEKKAMESGLQSDWHMYFTERERQLASKAKS